MSIFNVHRRIVPDDASNIHSFGSEADNELRQTVDQHINVLLLPES